jgi:uncharacterized RDD family membrane protein YckC
METARSEQAAQGVVAGFWVRVLSDVIDAIVLGVVGMLLAVPLGGVFERLGERGVLIGLPISLAYAGILQSRMGRGQTIGKRMLRLRVVKLDGGFLSLDRSFVRYALVAFPVYQTAIAYAVVMAFPFLRLEWIEALGTGLAAALFVSCFFVIPFHPLKRGLHDILTGSIVVRHGMLDPMFIGPRNDPRRDRRIVTVALVVAVLAAGAGVVWSPRSLFAFKAPATERVARDLGMSNFIIGEMTVKPFNGAIPVHNVFVSGFLPRPTPGGSPDWDRAARQLTAALREDVPQADDSTGVSLMLRTGYNIGITRSYENRSSRINLKTGEIVGAGVSTNVAF